jgi:glyoxylase-like metal-dependent hydrolase (beta-lactamase superfamily II)
MRAGADQLVFANAQFVVGREAWERARHPHARDKASFIPGLTEKLEASGRLTIVEGERLTTAQGSVFEDRLFFLKSFGHTPGHLHVGFRGDQQTVFFCGDLIPGRSWVHLPITMGYDRYPEMLIDEKAKLYPTAAASHWLLFFTHDPQVPAAEVRLNGDGKYEAVHERTELRRHAI